MVRKARRFKQMIHRGASPTDSQSQAIGVQVSLHVAGYHQARHSERRKASGQSVVVVLIFRAADSASSEIQCSVGGAARRRTAEGIAESTHCELVCKANCAVEGSMWEKLVSAGAERWPKVEVHWSEKRQQILGMGFAASTGTGNSFEKLAVTGQPSRQHERVNLRRWKGIPYPLLWQVR